MSKSEKPAEELNEEQLETVTGGIALAGPVAPVADAAIGVHNIDKSSPVLMQVCATGTHIKDATITH
jgi:bacteriocin-like protein